jgi:hypothetical protein
MKTANKALLILLALAFAVPAEAQYMGARVEYVKVKSGQWDNYRQLEKIALKVHQARVEEGDIVQWHMYRKMYAGADDPYDFILVHFYDDYMKSNNPFPTAIVEELFSEEERADMMKKVGETRTIGKIEYYDQVAASETFKPAPFIRMNRYKVEPGQAGRYVQSRREITQPLFSEFVKRGHMAGWTMWRKLTYDQEFQFVTVDAFEEFGQWKKGMPYQEIWKEVHPDKVQSEVHPEYASLRMPVSSEYWRLVEFTEPKQEN